VALLLFAAEGKINYGGEKGGVDKNTLKGADYVCPAFRDLNIPETKGRGKKIL